MAKTVADVMKMVKENEVKYGLPEAQKAALTAKIPLGRLGSPEDIAEAVAFITGPSAGYITGTELHVNGGMFMN